VEIIGSVNRRMEIDILDMKKTDDVVLHILNGQIEYDFELIRCGILFEKYKIPIILLETNYNMQGIEQFYNSYWNI